MAPSPVKAAEAKARRAAGIKSPAKGRQRGANANPAQGKVDYLELHAGHVVPHPEHHDPAT